MNKIIDYYTPNDERLPESYLAHKDLLGLDKHPFGLDKNRVLRFEKKDTNSKIWQDYKSYGNFENGVGDYNRLQRNFRNNFYTLEELIQFYREDGASLSYLIDVFSGAFYNAKDIIEFQKALEKIQEKEDIEEVKQDILHSIFLAHLNGTEDETILKYRIEARKIVNNKFGEGAWNDFVNSIKNKK